MIDLTEHGIVTPANNGEARVMLATSMVAANPAHLLTDIPVYLPHAVVSAPEEAHELLVLKDEDATEYALPVPHGFGIACVLGEPAANKRLRRVLRAPWN